MSDGSTPVRAGRRPTVDTRSIDANGFEAAMIALIEECRRARSDARYARAAEIDAERARERGCENAAKVIDSSATRDRAAAARRLARIAYRMRAALLWAAYDWHPGVNDPYAEVAIDPEDVLWRAIGEADGRELREV